MAEIKVLALDLDGTLTNDQKEVTPRTRAALDAAIERGVTVVLASGRPTAGITPLAKDLGLDKKGGCILSYNGGKIVDCRTGETLVEKTLDPALVPELCAFAAAQDVAILTYSSEGIVCERETDPWAAKETFTTKLFPVCDFPSKNLAKLFGCQVIDRDFFICNHCNSSNGNLIVNKLTGIDSRFFLSKKVTVTNLNGTGLYLRKSSTRTATLNVNDILRVLFSKPICCRLH